MKRLKIIAAAAVLFLLSATATVVHADSKIDPGCAYIVMEARTGQVITERNADTRYRPASTTKIMTAIVALENGKLDQDMNVSPEAVNDIGPGGMNIGILAGETGLTLENLLNVMLVKSANETANIIAENVGQTRAQFIDMMNKKAQELGAANTYFVNPCGKDDLKIEANHLTTPRDLANIARYAMTIPKFREIVSQEYYKGLPATNKHSTWPVLQNTNKLLWDNNKYPYSINGVQQEFTVEGIKTGFTSAAGHNLVSAAVNGDGMELICVVMHVTGDTNGAFTTSKELLKYGFEHYSSQLLVSGSQVVEKGVKVQDAKGDGSLDLVASSDLKAVLPLDKNSQKLQEEKHINENIKAPVKQGDVLGYIEYKNDGVSLGKVDLLAAKNIEQNIKEVVKEKSKNIFKDIIGSVFVKILLAVIIILLVRKHIRRSIRRKRKKDYITRKFGE
ncbi:MAG: D-alanyl-D-alanine carboxypeptidase family protein [Bacillota bacterium]|nr:D-alanyl-D-alanine carboxypeptidase family protein [Bacillota bacterium]